jgi:hypothetical protein
MRKVEWCAWTSPEISGVAARELVVEAGALAVLMVGACPGMASSFHELPGHHWVCLT